MATVNPLDAVVRRAGGVLVPRGGAMVAAHYGSAVGELSVCVSGVGLADRSDLVKLVVVGKAGSVSELVDRVTGCSLAPGGTTEAAGASWWRASASELIVLCEPAHETLLRTSLHQPAARSMADLRFVDASGRLAALALVGRNAPRVLAVATADASVADPRSIAPYTAMAIGGIDVAVLLQSCRRALVLVDSDFAGQVWQALCEAGAQSGLSCVGAEAVRRFALLDRRQDAGLAQPSG